MDSDLIQHLLVTTNTRFDVRGTPTEVRQYNYYVGQHGPFTDTYPEGQDTPDAVKAGFQKRIDLLRAVGAIPAAS